MLMKVSHMCVGHVYYTILLSFDIGHLMNQRSASQLATDKEPADMPTHAQAYDHVCRHALERLRSRRIHIIVCVGVHGEDRHVRGHSDAYVYTYT